MTQAVDLTSIAVKIVDRKWMKMAKAWRISLRLPESNALLAPVLSGMIETQVRIELGNEKGAIEIDPALIIDVMPKNRSFILQVETCYEWQNSIGPHVTAMINEDAVLYIGKPFEKPAPAQGLPVPVSQPKPAEDEEYRQKLVKGLHVLFQNHRFQQFIQSKLREQFSQSNQEISDHKECKAVFKSLSGVASCKDLSVATITEWREAFMSWVNGGDM